ncbi:hypothetical protein THAOC_02498 [Thalassiosira oceanica]|uniref:Uncharacterized protein n=1 Tax=Thalassiosira oceanica TaxID=159749 RepID=K0TEG1_THAOC|nr:hypothetical protein THAOC_02498 [Thalassiosira oceanica]|eukprot:EJK75770.1 hypothetical protein THAOC_02498 [Thalassiosira oceanica]
MSSKNRRKEPPVLSAAYLEKTSNKVRRLGRPGPLSFGLGGAPCTMLCDSYSRPRAPRLFKIVIANPPIHATFTPWTDVGLQYLPAACAERVNPPPSQCDRDPLGRVRGRLPRPDHAPRPPVPVHRPGLHGRPRARRQVRPAPRRPGADGGLLHLRPRAALRGGRDPSHIRPDDTPAGEPVRHAVHRGELRAVLPDTRAALGGQDRRGAGGPHQDGAGTAATPTRWRACARSSARC